MVFCNIINVNGLFELLTCHNPYFNRWFSAIKKNRPNRPNIKSHNPYFNRWFSAIDSYMELKKWEKSHNPYFNRWFSAIWNYIQFHLLTIKSQSLF